MYFVWAVAVLLFIFYAILIIYYYRSWRTMPDFLPKNTSISNVSFSIIIPARNEENNIGKLLQSITDQTYFKDLYEVIVVDDHSTDDTAVVVQQFPGVKLIKFTENHINSYKKKAIETGIAAAKNDWIVCTDADCMVPPTWLATIAAFISERKPVFVAAPVNFFLNKSSKFKSISLVYIFQVLDFLSLQGITAAAVHRQKHNMCNGANLAYKREVFYGVGGFAGIDNIASGDDMLLMHKIWQQYPDKIAYLKSFDAIVETASAPTWKAFFRQRIRWASKAKSYDDKRIFWVLLLVYFFNFSFLVLIIGAFFNINYWYAFIAFWLLKTMIEFPFVLSVSTFFKRQSFMKYFFFVQPIHIAYTIVAGFFGSFGKYEWKGRRVH